MRGFKIKAILIITIVVLLVGVVAAPALAQTGQSITERMIKGLTGVNLPTVENDPDAGAQTIIGNIINAFLGLFGAFFLVLVIYGGFKWMNARGNQEEMEKAKKILQSAVIGFIIVMLAYAISFFVASALQGVTTGT